MFVLLASLVLGACSSSDDGGNNGGGGEEKVLYTETAASEAPVWKIDWTNNQERPNWTEPEGSYENWTILKAKLEDELMSYASEGDLLAIFINGELRGLTGPASIDNKVVLGKFLLKAWGNESGTETVNMSLSYYSQQLKHIFTLTDKITLNPDQTTGFEEEFIPEFTSGSAKYPVMKMVNVESVLKKVGITTIQDGTVGAFVGEECRGTTLFYASGGTQLLIYGRSAGESIALKYYDATAGKLYTIPDAVKM